MPQSSKLKKVILLAFANHDQAHLSMLKAESEALEVIFRELSDRRSIRLVKTEEAKVETLHQILQDEKQTVIFHYAGHADAESIHLTDGKGYIEGLAPILGRLKQLKLVFLNGCATQDQVQFLLDQKVKAVIATRVPVNDSTAYEFSKAFYESFSKGNTIKASYEHACDYINFKYKDLLTYRINKRGIGRQKPKEDKGELNWNLYYQDPNVLLFRGVGVEADKIQADSALIRLIDRFRFKIPIRILLAVSSHELLPNGTIPPLNVYNEVALIKEYIFKLFMYSNLSRKFDLEVYLLKGHKTASLIIKSGQETNQDKIIPLPKLKSFDLISWLVWNNLGVAEDYDSAPLRLLYKDVFDLEERDRPSIQIFRRGEAIRSFVHTQSSREESLITRQAREVERFFSEIAGQRIIDYHPDLFEEEYEHHLRLWLKKLIPIKYKTQDQHQLLPLSKTAFRNPYKGLKPYEYQDANVFFGRINEVDQLRDQLAKQKHEGLLAVIGASGSGKSSLVRAGLFNRLRLNTIPGSRKWRFLECKLQKDHLECQAVSGDHSPLEDMSSTIQEYVQQGQAGAAQLIGELMKGRPENSRLVLFFDQFEEIFNLISRDQEEIRKEILNFVVAYSKLEQGQIILTMRSEYFHRCLEYPEFADRLKRGQQVLLRPSKESMIRIIVRPAMFSGLQFEEGLETKIWTETFEMGENLPLVSYVLEQLAEKREGNRMTVKAYEELGGVVGVIQKQADIAVAEFDTDAKEFKEDFNFLFRKLIKVEDGVEGKRPAPLDTQGWPPGAIALKDALVNQRLLRSDKHQLEIAHEALIRHWTLLQNWIIETRAALLTLAKTGKEAEDWYQDREGLASLEQQLKLDRNRLWSQARLEPVYEAQELLGIQDEELESLYPHTLDFIRPETDRLREELQYAFINHQRRNEIGNRLAELGDPRPGVGVKDGVPEIVWCAVPGGKVQITEWDKTFEVAPFYIAQYPVTLEQFNVFKEPKHYFTDKWWEGLPSNIHKAHKPKVQSPENMLNRPAEWVNWYHAVAYCRWLSNALGYQVRLPFEWEWLLAATNGEPKNNYPWGRNWDNTKANSSTGIGALAAVGLYPQGAAGNGASGLAGNAYEWCFNAFEQGAEGFDKTIQRTTKGGGWGKFDGPPNKVLNNYFRLGDFPHGINERNNDIRVCFRLVADEIPADALRYSVNNESEASA